MPTDARLQPAVSSPSDSMVSRFVDRASRDPERLALSVYPMGARQALNTLNWGDWITGARAVSGSLLAHGGATGERIAIFAENRPLWPVAALGIAMAGMVSVGIPPDSSADALVAMLADCAASTIVVDTVARYKLVRSVLPRLVRHITIVCDDLEPLRASTAEGLYEWEAWCRAGTHALSEYPSLRDKLSARIGATLAQDVAVMAYTPASERAVVLTHECLLASALVLRETFSIEHTDVTLCAQSFCEPFAALLGIYATILGGASALLLEYSGDALNVAGYCAPTVFSGPSSMVSAIAGELRSIRNEAGFGDERVALNIRNHLGHRCRLCVLYGAQLESTTVLDFQRAALSLASVFGTPEQICICENGLAQFEPGAIGWPLPSVQLRVGPHSELQVKRNALTARDTDSTDNWFNTGLRAERRESGAIVLVGAMNDLLTLSSGHQVAPHAVEAALCTLPLVSHAIVHADEHESLVAVLSLNRKSVEQWAFALGLVAPWEALAAHPLVYDELARGLAKVNGMFPIEQRISAFAPTDLEFSFQSGELNMAGEVVRSVVATRFHHVLADLHATPQF